MPLNLALLNERRILGVFWGAWRFRDGNVGNRKNIGDMMQMVRATPVSTGHPAVWATLRPRTASGVIHGGSVLLRSRLRR